MNADRVRMAMRGRRGSGLSLAGWRRLQRPRLLLALAALCALLQFAVAMHVSDFDQHSGGVTCVTCLALAQAQAAGVAVALPTLPSADPGPAPLAAPRDVVTAPACPCRPARAPPLTT
ncbi:MAG: hypothetical protein AB7Q81_14085 [Gammaproteobacteria bacterium]